ncbi:MFS transporter [Flexivirga caeni]|uniref:MFS transporter n=1 Tax=Flexivirga caeni TaxID=2294115 RepID=A0A3M9M4E9_9MICO|nr:MFS transporter [Flexivirga caeni]RNI20441.1 MFS transporter [Flexivirga caeni]
MASEQRISKRRGLRGATVTTPLFETNRRSALIILCAAMFLVLLDVSIVNVALPSIARNLGGGTSGAQAVIDSYTVPLAAFLLTAGAMADRWGARRTFAAGLLGFGLGSICCAAAPDLPVLMAGRIAQGAGAAGMLPASLALIAVIWDEPGRRARAIGVWSGISGSAVAIGPLVGGALVEAGGWRWIFVVNLPVVAAALAAAWLLPAGTRCARAIDWFGAAASTLCLGCLIAGVIELGEHGAGALALALLAGAAVCGIVFVAEQRRVPEPMVPRELWRNAALLRSCGGSLGMNLVGNGTLLVLAFLFQVVQHRGALAAGLATLPVFAPLTLVPLVGSSILSRMRPPVLIRRGFAAGVVGQLALVAAVLRAPHSAVAVVPGMVLSGCALGALVTPLVASAVAAAPSYGGLIGGLNNAARQTGTSVGVALFGAVTGTASAPSATGRMAGCFLLGAGIWLVSGIFAGRSPRDG